MKDTIWIKKGRFTPLAVVLMFAFPLVTALICLCFGRMNEIAAFYGVSVDYLLGNADSKEKQPDSQNENQAVKDELIAFYGDVKDDLTPDDIDDLMVAMRAKAERNKKKKSGM